MPPVVGPVVEFGYSFGSAAILPIGRAFRERKHLPSAVS